MWQYVIKPMMLRLSSSNPYTQKIMWVGYHIDLSHVTCTQTCMLSIDRW